IRFKLPHDAGEFRGQLIDARKIVGHWIQPANEINNNRHATPVELTQSGDKLWRCKVEPLEARLSFYLSIRQADGGSLTAIIRNPEFNLFRRNVYHVDRRGNELTFSDTKDSSNTFTAKFQADDARFVAHLPNIDGELVFKQREIGPGHEGDHQYRKPADIDDGWVTADLEDVGLNSKQLTQLTEKILDTDPVSNPVKIHSLLIARYGKLALEEYFYGTTCEQPHTMRSASKTFAPLLVGI